jgi:hypothetical protein
VTVLYGDDVVELHDPGTGEQHLHEFPWHLAIEAVDALVSPSVSPSVE